MNTALFQIIPGVALNKTIYLSPEDRKEALKNKWRDFNEKIVTKYGEQKIAEK